MGRLLLVCLLSVPVFAQTATPDPTKIEPLKQSITVNADIATWTPEAATDLLFANAAFQWLPDHTVVLRRLLEAFPAGGVLAVQMPDNTREPAHLYQREVAEAGPWADNPAMRAAVRPDLPPAEAYYDCSGRTAPASISGTASTIT